MSARVLLNLLNKLGEKRQNTRLLQNKDKHRTHTNNGKCIKQ